MTNSPNPKTMDWLIGRYLGSIKFTTLGQGTKRTRTATLNRLSSAHGHRLHSELTPEIVKSLMIKERLKNAGEAGGKETPEAANSLLKIIRLLFNFAIDELKIKTDNPATNIQLFASTTGGYHTWSEAEIKQFENRFPLDSKEVLALRLFLFTGGTRIDLAGFGPKNIRKTGDDARFEYTRTKTKVFVNVPVREELQDALDQHQATDRYYFTHDTGKSYTSEGFGNWFSERCTAAGLPHCTSHGVRKFGATTLAECGATEWQIMAYLGHKTPDEARTYVARANRGKLGDGAMSNLKLSNLKPWLDK